MRLMPNTAAKLASIGFALPPQLRPSAVHVPARLAGGSSHGRNGDLASFTRPRHRPSPARRGVHARDDSRRALRLYRPGRRKCYRQTVDQPVSRRRPSAEAFLLTATAAALVGGVAAHAAGADAVRTAFWATGTAIGLVAACAWTVGDIRRGKLGVDLIAVLALVGTAVTGELFAGAVIALMLASGRALEARAGARAQRDLRLLLQRAPQTAHRRCGDELTSPPLDDVGPGDLLEGLDGTAVMIESSTAFGSSPFRGCGFGTRQPGVRSWPGRRRRPGRRGPLPAAGMAEAGWGR